MTTAAAVNFSMATSWLPALLAATPSSKAFFTSLAFATSAALGPAAPGVKAKLASTRLRQVHANVGRLRPQLLVRRGDLVVPRRQANLDELAAAVGLDLELASDPIGELDRDGDARQWLAFGIDDLAP